MGESRARVAATLVLVALASGCGDDSADAATGGSGGVSGGAAGSAGKGGTGGSGGSAASGGTGGAPSGGGSAGAGGSPCTPLTAAEIDARTFARGMLDTELASGKSSFDSMAGSNLGDTYYTFQYILTGVISAFEGTGDPKYLELALGWAKTMVGKATIIDETGTQNWGGV